jgi:NAD(P)-dependent dehydrogenase (short-subunit alcohol dehydrogenase family)
MGTDVGGSAGIGRIYYVFAQSIAEMERLKGKRALITGAPSELALAVGAALAAAGASVALAGTGESALPLNVTDAASCERAVRMAAQRLGGLDVLCNVAASPEPALGKALHELAEDEWDRATSETIDSVLLVSRFALPLMREAGGGSIVNVSHAAALVGIPGTALLAATTGALLNMTRAMAVSSEKDRVRVNCVCLGSHVGGAFRPTVPSLSEAQRSAPVAASDMAPLFVFLASDESKHVNGQVLAADDGLSAWRPGG